MGGGGGDGFFSHGRSNARWVAILFRKGFSPNILTRFIDNEGRLVILQIDRDGDILTLANIYAPTQSEGREKERFMGNLEEYLADMEISSLLIRGDFNIQLPVHAPRSPQIDRSPRTLSYVNHILALTLADLWRLKNPSSGRGTFHRGPYSARLDYWLVPHSLAATS